MADLRKRFGKLVAAHRRRNGMTQAQLAEAARLSQTMIVCIEGGKTGARFPSIERLAEALKIDPAELFVVGSSSQGRGRPAMIEINARLTGLSDRDLGWVDDLLAAALKSRG